MAVEAAADPTMVERQVRADQEARQQVHFLTFSAALANFLQLIKKFST